MAAPWGEDGSGAQRRGRRVTPPSDMNAPRWMAIMQLIDDVLVINPPTASPNKTHPLRPRHLARLLRPVHVMAHRHVPPPQPRTKSALRSRRRQLHRHPRHLVGHLARVPCLVREAGQSLNPVGHQPDSPLARPLALSPTAGGPPIEPPPGPCASAASRPPLQQN